MNDIINTTQDTPKHNYIRKEFEYLHKETILLEQLGIIIAYYIKIHRPRNKAKIESWKFNMQMGRWNSDAGNIIKFDWDGNLIDGQHRVYAAFELGIPFVTEIQMGLDPKSVEVIDGGLPRRPNVNPILVEAMKIGVAPMNKDYTKHKDRQSIARLMKAIEEDKAWVSPDTVTLEHLVNQYRKHIDLVCDLPLKGWMRRPGPRAAIAQYSKLGYTGKATEFLTQYITGMPAMEGSPVALLRNRISTVKSQGGNGTKDDLAVTIDAIHYFHQGVKVNKYLRKRTKWEI